MGGRNILAAGISGCSDMAGPPANCLAVVLLTLLYLTVAVPSFCFFRNAAIKQLKAKDMTDKSDIHGTSGRA